MSGRLTRLAARAVGGAPASAADRVPARPRVPSRYEPGPAGRWAGEVDESVADAGPETAATREAGVAVRSDLAPTAALEREPDAPGPLAAQTRTAHESERPAGPSPRVLAVTKGEPRGPSRARTGAGAPGPAPTADPSVLRPEPSRPGSAALSPTAAPDGPDPAVPSTEPAPPTVITVREAQPAEPPGPRAGRADVVAARLPPRQDTSAAEAEPLPTPDPGPPVVRVSIGRLEVRATLAGTPTAPAAPPPPVPAGPRADPPISLTDYLRGRREAR